MLAGNLPDSGTNSLLLLDGMEQKSKRMGSERKGRDGANGIKDSAQERHNPRKGRGESGIWNWVELTSSQVHVLQN